MKLLSIITEYFIIIKYWNWRK